MTPREIAERIRRIRVEIRELALQLPAEQPYQTAQEDLFLDGDLLEVAVKRIEAADVYSRKVSV